MTSENIPGRTLVVVLAPELQQDQTVYGVGLQRPFPRGSCEQLLPFRRGEQVIVPNGTVTFPVGEISTTTTICDLVHSVRAACGGNYLFGWSRRLRDWVESYYRCHRGRSVDLHFLSRTIGGGHVPSCVQHRYAPF